MPSEKVAAIIVAAVKSSLIPLYERGTKEPAENDGVKVNVIVSLS